MGCGASAAGKYEKQLDSKQAEISTLQEQVQALRFANSEAKAALPTATPKADSEDYRSPQVIADAPIFCGDCRGLTYAEESSEAKASRQQLMACLQLRLRYAGANPAPLPKAPLPGEGRRLCMVMVDGLAEIEGLDLPKIPSREDYRTALIELWKLVKSPAVRSLSMSRLERLSNTYSSYVLDHAKHEQDGQVELIEDVYSVMKVDNHIHLAAAMSPVMFLKFIRQKLKDEPQRKVAQGKTLRMICQEAVDKLPKPPSIEVSKLDNEALGNLIHADSLRMCAGDHFYHRFDNFNSAYCPLGSDLLRTVFMKTNNEMEGEYFGQLTQEIIQSMERHHTFAEMRLSIYGRKANEWDDLARWLKKHDLHKPPWTKRNLWLVQIPRVFKAFLEKKFVNNFEEFLNNIFQALFEVALEPSTHPELAEVLPSIVGFDCVDDESIADPLLARRSQVYGSHGSAESVDEALHPKRWNVAENPPYSYYCYFLSCNLRRFNDLCRTLKRPWHLSFRPHSGEAGEVHHLATAFLTADGINHGINLYHTPVLQYLYYLAQIGISVAPISNNSLFLRIKDNPFPFLFRRGLNVTLSTDDPLMFHATNQPLLEEYTAARLVFGLSTTDLCEIAANSVRQSGFPLDRKAAALGDSVYKPGRPYAWTPETCNIPDRRLRYRRQNLANELAYLRDGPQAVAEIPVTWEEPHWASYAS